MASLFEHTVAWTIFFWKWKILKFSYSFRIMAILYAINWIVAAETIEGGNYSRVETISQYSIYLIFININGEKCIPRQTILINKCRPYGTFGAFGSWIFSRTFQICAKSDVFRLFRPWGPPKGTCKTHYGTTDWGTLKLLKMLKCKHCRHPHSHNMDFTGACEQYS